MQDNIYFVAWVTDVNWREDEYSAEKHNGRYGEFNHLSGIPTYDTPALCNPYEHFC